MCFGGGNGSSRLSGNCFKTSANPLHTDLDGTETKKISSAVESLRHRFIWLKVRRDTSENNDHNLCAQIAPPISKRQLSSFLN